MNASQTRAQAVSGSAPGNPGSPARAGRGPVLEIGGGHNPYPQSDVIVDKFLDNKERAGDLKLDGRPVVIADFQQLPFKDGSFAYAICSHVLEHVEDVDSALGELTRVAQAGYLETPSALNEVLEPHRAYHRWYVARQGRKLLFYPKRSSSLPAQKILNKLLMGNWAFKLFYLANPDLSFTRLHWRKAVEYQVMPDSAQMELDKLYPSVRQSPFGMAAGLARHVLGRLARRMRDRLRARKAPVDITALLCCPICKSSFAVDGDRLNCARCGGYFRREGSVYRLLKEDLVPA